MFPINQFGIKKVSETDTQGTFVVGPMSKGYGSTLGTVFRRILLSSIPGSAVTSVKVGGVDHEYTTIAGLQDDVLKVVLALKNLSLVSHSEAPVVLKLNAKGKKGEATEVTAAEFEKNSEVEIINPELVITTLADEKAELNIEITVERGIGYQLPNEDVRQEIGTIPMDASFNPVKAVSMNVASARVGQQTDLDQLELVVTTNGTVSPSAAVYEAAQILLEVSQHLVTTAGENLSKKAEAEVQEAILPLVDQSEQEDTTAGAKVLIKNLNLSTRLANALVNSGYEDLSVMNGLTEEELRNIKGMGEKSFQELLDILKENGIKLI